MPAHPLQFPRPSRQRSLDRPRFNGFGSPPSVAPRNGRAAHMVGFIERLWPRFRSVGPCHYNRARDKKTRHGGKSRTEGYLSLLA